MSEVVAQESKSAIIVIDRTLPRWIGIECISEANDTIKLYYNFSEIMIDSLNQQKMSLLAADEVLKVNFYYKEFNEDMGFKRFCFTTSMRKKVFWSNGLLISITTFNRSKSIYYVDYAGNGWRKAFKLDKSFGNPRRALKKIKSIYPRGTHF